MKKLVPLILILAALALSGCYDSADTTTSVDVNRQQEVYIKNQPIPFFDWSLERDVFIQLYNLRNTAVSTYTVVASNMGTVLFECPSIGYPLAADVQLTNPLRLTTNYAVIEQAEPNGLFSSKNTAGTWIMCVLEDGSVYPLYTELNANTWPMPVVKGEDGLYHPALGAIPSGTLDLNR